MARAYGVVVYILGGYVFFDGIQSLILGGGASGAVGVTNGLLSGILGVLLIVSGQLAWTFAVPATRPAAQNVATE